MDDELELLKDLGRDTADPDDASVTRARTLLERRIERARGRRRPPWRPFHLRWSLTVALALLLGGGLGFVMGTANTSSGTAANSPVGLGFLPERGWSVLQTAKEATLAQEAIAIAANVPISPDDAADRLPYATMLNLPPSGVVILASFTARGDKWRDQFYPVRALPLRLRDAAPGIIQVRPERPLGQYQLRAGINGHNVEVTVYFGTPRPAPAVITAAQRQLDRLVVRPVRRSGGVEERAFPIRAVGASQAARRLGLASRVVDRTLVCTLSAPLGGPRDLDLLAQPPIVDQFRNFSIAPFIGVSSGPVYSGPVTDRSNRVFVRARTQAKSGTGGLPYNALPPGVYASARYCSATKAHVPLSSRGLSGPPFAFEHEAECQIRGRVLVRVRARLQSMASWRRIDGAYVGARANVREAKLVVRSERTREPIAFIELRSTGRTRFWGSSGCA